MIHVVLDTSIFRKDPFRKKAAFELLYKLGKTNRLKLHIPYFVKNEHLSQKIHEYIKPLETTIQNLKTIHRKPLPENVKQEVEKQLESLNKIHFDTVSYVETDFDDWLKEIGAKVYEIENHHGANIAELYFKGELPFKEKKNRNDFPDAFIWQTILDIVEKVDKLNVVAADTALNKTCMPFEKISIYESLDELIKSDKCFAALRDHDFESQFDDILLNLKENEESILETFKELILAEYLERHTFHDPNIPDDNNEATISVINEINELNLTIDEAEYYGDGMIIIPFSCNIDVLAEYWIFKSDYYTISEKRIRTINIEEYGNRHYYEAEENFELNVHGYVSINFELSSVPKTDSFFKHLKKLLDYADIEIDRIEDIEVADNYDY